MHYFTWTCEYNIRWNRNPSHICSKYFHSLFHLISWENPLYNLTFFENFRHQVLYNDTSCWGQQTFTTRKTTFSKPQYRTVVSSAFTSALVFGRGRASEERDECDWTLRILRGGTGNHGEWRPLSEFVLCCMSYYSFVRWDFLFTRSKAIIRVVKGTANCGTPGAMGFSLSIVWTT